MAVINANSSSSLTVLEDVIKGSHTAVSYLIKCGHIRIGMIAVKDALTTKKFVDGYQEALRENAIPIAESFIVYGLGSREAGFCGANTLFMEKCTAIFCMNDGLAAGVYDFMYQNSIEPGVDISVVGYGDKELSRYLVPPLTTVRSPLSEMGRKACQLLVGKPKTQKISEEHFYLPPSLVERGSVGAPAT